MTHDSCSTWRLVCAPRLPSQPRLTGGPALPAPVVLAQAKSTGSFRAPVLSREDVATFGYTSGTSGNPKACGGTLCALCFKRTLCQGGRQIEHGCTRCAALCSASHSAAPTPVLSEVHSNSPDAPAAAGRRARLQGAMLTHGNLLYQLETLDFLRLQQGQSTVTYLPPWHAYGRALE